ncbi:MAG: TonB family protein [Cyanobacteria bacterium P01_F01_bin.33]
MLHPSNRDRPTSSSKPGRSSFWRLLGGTQLRAQFEALMTIYYVELSRCAFRSGTTGIPFGVKYFRAAVQHFGLAALFRHVHLAWWADLSQQPLLKSSQIDLARDRAQSHQQQRIRVAYLGSLALHGVALAAWVTILGLLPPIEPAVPLIPFEFVELPPEVPEEPEPPEEELEELTPPEPPAAPPVAAAPPPPAPPVPIAPAPPPVPIQPPPQAVVPPPEAALSPPPPDPEQTIADATLSQSPISVATPPPVEPTPTPSPKLEPLLESFRTNDPPKLLELPQQPPAPIAAAPIEPPPTLPPTPQLEPLLESFRTDNPPELLALPPRSPAPDPVPPPVEPEVALPSPAPVPSPTLRPPPPLAVLPSTPAPIVTESVPAPPVPEPQAALTQPTSIARPIPGRQRQPTYPAQAKQRNQQGRVLIRARVDETGRVVQVEVTDSSGFSSLDDAAVVAVRAWEFTPARRGEVAIASWVNVPINFALQ